MCMYCRTCLEISGVETHFTSWWRWKIFRHIWGHARYGLQWTEKGL